MVSNRPAPNVVLSLVLAAAIAAGVIVLPPAVAGLRAIRPDATPGDIVSYRLRAVPAASYAAAIGDALTADDPDLAASLVTLADSRAVPLAPDLRKHVEDAQGFDAKRSLKEAWGGLTGGDAKSPEALAGAVTADMTGISDARDLVHEGRAYLNNQPYSPLTMGLAAAGLVVTGVTVASLGAATPARVGVTALKVADKADLLSQPLRRTMTSVATNLVDTNAMKETLDLAAQGDVNAARLALTRSVRAEPLAALTTTASDLGMLAKSTGYRATHDVLKLADSPADISRLRRMAESFGPRFRGALVLVGGAALTTAGILASASGWLLAALMWILVAAFTAFKLVRWLWYTFVRRQPGGGRFPHTPSPRA